MPYVSDRQRRFFNANKKRLASQGVNVGEWNKASKGMKLPEKVSTKEALGPTSLDDILANDVVPMDTTSGALADYITPGAWGGERAGRSQTLASAAGTDVPFRVRHPLLSSWGAMGLGGLAGAGVGAGAGLATGSLMNMMGAGETSQLSGTGLTANQDVGMLIGGGVGGLAGMAGGPLLSAYLRRQNMRDINDAFDSGHGEPDVPDLSRLSALLLPGRGPHRKGQVDAYRYLTGDGEDVRRNATLNDAGYIGPMLAAGLPAPVSQGLNLAHGYGQNFATQDWKETLDRNKRMKAVEDMTGMKAAGWEEIKNQIAGMSSAAAGAVKQQGGNAIETLQRAATGAGTALLPWKERALVAVKQLTDSAITHGQAARQHIQEGLSDPNRRPLYAAALGAGGAGSLALLAEMTNRRPRKRLLSSLVGGAGAGALLGASGLYAADQLGLTGFKPGQPSAAAGASTAPQAKPTVNPQQSQIEQLTQRINSLPLEQRAPELERLKQLTTPTVSEQVYNQVTSNPLTSSLAIGGAGYSAAAATNRLAQGFEANQAVPGGRGLQNSLAFQLPNDQIQEVLKKRIMSALPGIDAGDLDVFLARPDVSHAMRFDPNALPGLAASESASPAAKMLTDHFRDKPHMLGAYTDVVNSAARTTGFQPNTVGLKQRLINALPFSEDFRSQLRTPKYVVTPPPTTGPAISKNSWPRRLADNFRRRLGAPKASPWTPANSASVAGGITGVPGRPRMFSGGIKALAALPLTLAGDAAIRYMFQGVPGKQ